MRNTITTIVLCLLTLLSAPGFPAAAEPQAEPQDDEKITVPAPGAPGRSGTVILVPTPSPAPGQTVIVPHPPGKTSPVEIPVVPVVPDRIAPVEVPVIPVLPDKTTPVEIPVVPVLPQTPDRTTVLTPPHQQETPQKEAIAPYSASPPPEPPAVPDQGKQASPMDFLPMPTLLDPEKAQPEAKPEKDKQPGKTRPEEPKAQPPLKAEPSKPKSGDPLRIPPDAAKTGDLAFLEGCWRGTRPEYTTRRTITERFCFDKNGNAKRFIDDPQKAGKCTGDSKGSFDAQGRLNITSERAKCTRGSAGSAHMVCEGEGNATPCSWRFPDAGGGTQSYKIPFVRE